MNILITGFAGFVGRAFTKRLLLDGHTIVGVDNFSSTDYPGTWWPRDKASKFYNEDVREYFRRHKSSQFDLVIHCAAVVGGRLKIDGDPLAVATDLAIDSDMFNWAVRSKPMPRVVYFSSSAVYPLELQVRNCYCDLSEPLVNFDAMRIAKPDMSYGWCKLTGEYLAKFAAEQYGLDVKVYRPFGGYGEEQSFDYPFPSIIRRVLLKQDPVVVWGSGDQQRDFIHVDDIVAGVLETMDKLPSGEVLNLGTSRAVSFRDLALLAGATSVENDSTRPEGVFRRIADTHKLFQYYKPKITLEEGIQRVAKHLQKSLDGSKVAV